MSLPSVRIAGRSRSLSLTLPPSPAPSEFRFASQFPAGSTPHSLARVLRHPRRTTNSSRDRHLRPRLRSYRKERVEAPCRIELLRSRCQAVHDERSLGRRCRSSTLSLTGPPPPPAPAQAYATGSTLVSPPVNVDAPKSPIARWRGCGVLGTGGVGNAGRTSTLTGGEYSSANKRASYFGPTASPASPAIPSFRQPNDYEAGHSRASRQSRPSRVGEVAACSAPEASATPVGRRLRAISDPPLLPRPRPFRPSASRTTTKRPDHPRRASAFPVGSRRSHHQAQAIRLLTLARRG
jgi:hypothetical protein